MKLYFQHSNGVQDYLCDVSDICIGLNEAMSDLKKRAPHFVSYYQRVWTDKDKITWIDVGSWSEYYLIK